MLIDILALGLLLLAIWKGLSKGLIVAVFSLLAFIVGLAAALKLSTLVAGWMGSATNISGRWLPVLAFFFVFILVALLVRLGARMLEGAVRLAMLGWVNKIGGIIFYILIYLFIFSIVLFYAQRLSLIRPEVAGSSLAYGLIAPVAPAIMDALGAVIPFFRDMFDALLQFFESARPKSETASYSAYITVMPRGGHLV